MRRTRSTFEHHKPVSATAASGRDGQPEILCEMLDERGQWVKAPPLKPGVAYTLRWRTRTEQVGGNWS